MKTCCVSVYLGFSMGWFSVCPQCQGIPCALSLFFYSCCVLSGFPKASGGMFSLQHWILSIPLPLSPFPDSSPHFGVSRNIPLTLTHPFDNIPTMNLWYFSIYLYFIFKTISVFSVKFYKGWKLFSFAQLVSPVPGHLL